MAASVPHCLRDASSACSPVMIDKNQEAQPEEFSIAENRERPQRDTQKISLVAPIPITNKTSLNHMTASDQNTLNLDLHFGSLARQEEESEITFPLSVTTGPDGAFEHCVERKKIKQDFVLPTTTEKRVYISKVELGPLYPGGSSISHFQSNLHSEAQTEAIVKMAQMIKLLSSCPQYSRIPGMPCLQQPRVIAWPDKRRSLVHKCRSDRMLLALDINYMGYLNKDRVGIEKNVSLQSTCARSSSTPGFPSAFTCGSNMSHILPTCPRISKILGLASVELEESEQSFWDVGSLWKQQARENVSFLSQFSVGQEQAVSDPNVFKVSVSMLSTCSRKVSFPRFPSASLQEALIRPSMVSLLPTCPNQTRIAGMPFREKVLSYNNTWHISREIILDKQLSCKHVFVQGNSHENIDLVKYMARMLPSCPWRAIIPYFPSVSQTESNVPGVLFAASQNPSMADFLPTCPRKTRVIGLPSKKVVSYQRKDLDVNHILIERPLSKRSILIHDNFTVALKDWEKRKMFSMVAMLPSYPVRRSIVHMPTVPQKPLPSIFSLVPMCPKQTQIPGMPSLHPNTTKNRNWHAWRQIIKRRDKTTQACIGQWILKNTDILKGIVDMYSCCPQKAKVFGLPSALWQEPCMVYLLPSCPRQSRVSGLPSKTGQIKFLSNECKKWFAFENVDWKSLFIERKVRILYIDLFFYKNTDENMGLLLPSCPGKSSIPGFPSALTLTDGSNMVNLLHSCPKESGVPGIPLRDSTKPLEWETERTPLLFPLSELTLHYWDVFNLDSESELDMISILPSCPQTACLPGFPSLSCQKLADIPNMTNLLFTCPNYSRICGIPSRFHSGSDGTKWIGNVINVGARPLRNSFRLFAIHNHMMYFREKALMRIMVSMLPPCPKCSHIPGIPSKVGGRALLKGHPGMLKSLGTFPKHSKIPGLPSKNTAKEGWYFPRNVVCKDWFNRRYGRVQSDLLKFNSVVVMSHSDREIMLSMLPSCPQQVLHPGFPSASQFQAADAIKDRNVDIVKLLHCCPRLSNIFGFPSRISKFSNSELKGKPFAVINMQESSACYKKYGSSHSISMNVTVLLKASPHALSSDIIAVSSLDLDQCARMVNIVPSCPKKSPVIGVPSTHVHHSGVGWPGKKPLLITSGTETPEEKRGNQRVRQWSLEESCQIPPEDKLQRMAIESSSCPFQLTVQESALPNNAIQLDQPSSGVNFPEMLYKSSPAITKYNAKKHISDACSTLEIHENQKCGWILSEAKEKSGDREKG